MRARKPSFDSDAQTIFDAFTTPPSAQRKIDINTCVVSLKSNSLWTKLDGLWMFAAADEQASLINWKNPGTFNATQVEPTTAITFNADQGYTGNGSDNYIKTNLTLNTGGLNFTEDSASYGVWSRSTAQAATSLMAANTAGGAWSALIVPRNGSDQALARNNQAAAGGEATASSVTDGSGLLSFSREREHRPHTLQERFLYRDTEHGIRGSRRGRFLRWRYQQQRRARQPNHPPILGGLCRRRHGRHRSIELLQRNPRIHAGRWGRLMPATHDIAHSEQQSFKGREELRELVRIDQEIDDQPDGQQCEQPTAHLCLSPLTARRPTAGQSQPTAAAHPATGYGGRWTSCKINHSKRPWFPEKRDGRAAGKASPAATSHPGERGFRGRLDEHFHQTTRN